MCLAIAKPAGVAVPEANLHAGWISNSDGGGFAFIKDGKVEIRKGFDKWKSFLESYTKAAEENKDSPFAIHFRIRSTGGKEMGNTHPFRYAHGCVIHNGTISGTGADTYKGETDTQRFIQKFGSHFTYDFVKEHLKDLTEAIGYNKLVFLYPDKRILIVNESGGLWHDDVWYSNHSFKKRG